jgi:hypothetical protein
MKKVALCKSVVVTGKRQTMWDCPKYRTTTIKNGEATGRNHSREGKRRQALILQSHILNLPQQRLHIHFRVQTLYSLLKFSLWAAVPWFQRQHHCMLVLAHPSAHRAFGGPFTYQKITLKVKTRKYLDQILPPPLLAACLWKAKYPY